MLITGDLSFAESYQAREEERGRENVLKIRGYEHTVEKLSGLLGKSDLVIGNFETTLVKELVSPFAETKSYVHWSDVRETPRQLLAHNIRAVSLANNHSIDFGDAGLLQTLQVLRDAGIEVFGAGADLAEAQKPFSHEADLRSASGLVRRVNIKVFAAFAVDDKYRTQFDAYAGPVKPGTNPLHVDELAAEIARTKQSDPSTFVVALLHWRRDYQWRSEPQLETARRLTEAGADIVTGHGSHMLQEIEKVAYRWICHGLGNFVYNTPGMYERTNAPPFSLVGRLIFSAEASPRYLLYPLFTDNRRTGYQSRFVSDAEFDEVIRLLRSRTNDLAGFDLDIGTGRDEFGHFIELPLTATVDRARSSTRRKIQSTRPSVFKLSVHTYKGPNIHVRRPAIRCKILIKQRKSFPEKGKNRAVSNLLGLFPELEILITPKAKNVSSLNKSKAHTAFLAEISAILAYNLMRLIEEWIPPVTSRLLEVEKSGYYLICEYRRSPRDAKAAVELALEILAACYQSADELVEMEQKLSEFKRRRHGSTSAYLLEEAEHRRIPVSASNAGRDILGLGCFQKRLRETMTSSTGYLAVEAAKDKVQALDILRQAGIPVPKQIRTGNKADAIAAANRIGYPVVVKPEKGNHGKGVSTRLMSDDAVAGAFDQAAAISRLVIVESHIVGNDYRFLVVDGELVAASERMPGHVVGNGKDTIERLLDSWNAEARQDERLIDVIEYDFDTEHMLKVQGLTLQSIPENGKLVKLRSKADMTDHGVGLIEKVHPDNRLLAIACARALQLDIAGIDFITSDISRSHKETNGAVCEVNNRPAIMDLHVYPPSGSSVAVAPSILDMLFRPPSTGRIPTIVVLGDRFDDRLSHRIAHLLQVSGYQVGLATQEGSWVGGDLIAKGEGSNFDGARRVLLHPCVSAAVIEVSATSALNEGLGFDFADVAIISGEFLARSGSDDQSRHLMALIRSTVRTLILEGDAADTDDVLTKSERNKIYLVNPPTAHPRHLGAIRVTADDGTFTLSAGAESIASIDVTDLGSSAGHFMHAAAVCHATGISTDMIQGALRTSIDADQADPLLIGGLITPFGQSIMATPRNGGEVELLARIARSWAASQSPDIIVHMIFEGDCELQAALKALSLTGVARTLGGDSHADLASLVFKGGDRKVFILTDNMEFFRKRLGRDDLTPSAQLPFAGKA